MIFSPYWAQIYSWDSFSYSKRERKLTWAIGLIPIDNPLSELTELITKLITPINMTLFIFIVFYFSLIFICFMLIFVPELKNHLFLFTIFITIIITITIILLCFFWYQKGLCIVFICLFVEITYFGVMIVLMVILFYNIFDFYLLTLQKELLVVFYALTLWSNYYTHVYKSLFPWALNLRNFHFLFLIATQMNKTHHSHLNPNTQRQDIATSKQPFCCYWWCLNLTNVFTGVTFRIRTVCLI